MAPRRTSFAARALRTGLLAAALAAALPWAVPRVAQRFFGRGLFLREEFFHPAEYHVGGLTVAGRTLGGRTVDCRRLVRPAAAPGRNALANPGLDGPCGWGFAPQLGSAAAGARGEGADGWFRLEGGAGFVFQDVRLGALAGHVERGELAVRLTGRCRAGAGAPAQIVLEAFSGEWADRVVRGSRAVDCGGGTPGRWEEAAVTWEPPAGTRGVRVILRAPGGAAGFDGLALVPRRVRTAATLGLP